MTTKEKFEGFKKTLIEDNETKYGKEAREKYGDEAIEAGNAKLMGLNEKQYAEMQELSQQINDKLKTAFEQGDPSGALAQQVCAMHKEWLGYTWGSYSKEAHRGLAQLYVEDERFKAYYDSIAEGCAEFLRDALDVFCR
jgi:erythromycin esterase-like protein